MATQKNKRILHRKEWQMMTPAPTASVAGSFILKDPLGIMKTALYVVSATVQYLYAIDEDGFEQIPSMALAGTFGAGACGAWVPWSNTVTATTGGTVGKAITTTQISGIAKDKTVRFLTGANAGLEVVIASVKINLGVNSEITFKTNLPNVVSNGDTFVVQTGRYVVMNAGTIGAGIIKTYDVLTGVVTSLGTTGLPATWGTDGKLVATPSYVGAFATGTATSGGASTLTNSGKAWATNQWANFQVRITAGTGIGQVKSIATNNGTVLTITGTWAVNPDATSVYAIEGNDDFLYLAGNGAVAMYRYSFTSNSWTTLAPTVARGGVTSTGMSLNWCGKSGEASWQDENAIQDGRYIFSFRGASATLDRYDIAGGTAGAGAWLNVVYIRSQETFTTGSSFDYDTGKIFIKQNATSRLFYYDIIGNQIYPFSTDFFPDGTAVIGDKMFTADYSDGAGENITWVYYLQNTGTALRRIMVY